MPQHENLSTPFWEKIDPAGRMLRIRDVVHLTGLSRSQIYALIAEGRFPPLVKLSTRASAVPEAWLNAYLRICAGRDVCATDLHGEDA